MKLIVISSPVNLPSEVDIVNALFKEGLHKFHLRKPNMPTSELVTYLERIDPDYLKRVVIHYDFSVLQYFPEVGFHFNQFSLNWLSYNGFKHKSYSAHSVNEILSFDTEMFNYIFLSPVFDSISKPGYSSGVDLNEIQQLICSGSLPHPIVALGGVDKHNIKSLRNIGFYGVALLGAIWTPYQHGENNHNIINKFLQIKNVCQPDLMY